jgi:hypothetical protein
MWFCGRSDGEVDTGDLSLKRSRNTGDFEGVVVAPEAAGLANSWRVGFTCAGGCAGKAHVSRDASQEEPCGTTTTYEKVRIDCKQAETGRDVVWLDDRHVESRFSDYGGLGARGKRGRRGVWAGESGSYSRGGIDRGGSRVLGYDRLASWSLDMG